MNSPQKEAVTPPTRIQQNLLARSERRLLNYLCARLPAWVTPDQLTTLGFIGALMVTAGYILSWLSAWWLLLPVAGYLVNWFGDSLDGSLARWRKIERPAYGYFLDHSVDSLTIFLMIGGLGISPYMRFDVALICVATYLLLAIHTFLAAKVMGEFRLSYMAGGPTELRLMLIAMTGAMGVFGSRDIPSTNMSPFDIFGLGVAGILLALFLFQTFTTARHLRSRGL